MKDLVKNFIEQVRLHPDTGDYINLAHAVRGENYTPELLRRAFVKLIPRDQYIWGEREGYIKHLFTL